MLPIDADKQHHAPHSSRLHEPAAMVREGACGYAARSLLPADTPMRILYSALLLALLPAIVLRMLWRSRRAPAYRRRLQERLGWFPALADERAALWVHAVSLGETLAARPLVERLLADCPEYRLLVTTTTPTGSEQVQTLFGGRVQHVYAPWDTPGAVKRFLHRVRPRLLVLMETELWPNMLHYCQSAGCRVILANARLSARSAARYARFPGTTRKMLAALDWVAAQARADADRFARLGMETGRMAVSGSMKFDIRLDDTLREAASTLRRDWGLETRPVVIAASTHRGEDELILDAFAELRAAHPGALLFLAPRHPERFGEVRDLCGERGFERRTRSSGVAPTAETGIVVVDTLGELLLLFGVADAAVIGGSFIPNGGHNPLEAALWGLPILCGPSMFNFADVAARLAAAGALEQVQGASGLYAGLHALLGDAAERERRGRAALAVMESNRGALGAVVGAVERLLRPVNPADT